MLLKEGADMFGIFVRLLASLFMLYAGGCGNAKVRTDETTQAYVPVELLRTEPAYLSEIKPDTPITLYFQGVPIDFKSSTGDVIVKGQTVTFTVRKGDFIGGYPCVRVGWRTGRRIPMRWNRLTIEDDLQTLTWTSKPLPSKSTRWVAAIEADAVEPKKSMPVKFLRAEPPLGTLITDTDPILLYFDNRPRHVQIMKAPYYISKAIVKDNTVEISQTPEAISRPRRFAGMSFWVKWTDGNQRVYYKNFVRPPEDRVASFLRADPLRGSSMRAIDTVVLYFDAVPFDVEIRPSLPNVGHPIIRGKTVEVPITHPIKEPSLNFRVVWWSKSKKRQTSILLFYSIREVAPEE